MKKTLLMIALAFLIIIGKTNAATLELRFDTDYISSTVAEGEEVRLFFSKSGYDFGGWIVEEGEDCLTDKSSKNTSFIMPSGKVAVRAIYNETKFYTVEYYANGGRGSMDNEKSEVQDGAITTLKANGFTSSNRKFKGWCMNSNGSGTIYQPGDNVVITDDTIFYAIWEEMCTITFNKGKGLFISGTMNSLSVPKGSKTTLPTNKFNCIFIYEFEGWDTSSSASTVVYKDKAEITVNENITLYAVWSSITSSNTTPSTPSTPSTIKTPTLAAGQTWFSRSGHDYDSIEIIDIVDTYTGTYETSWAADDDGSGDIMCYINGTILTIAGNGAGSINANTNSSSAFAGFKYVTSINGLGLLDTSSVANMSKMFYNCSSLSTLDLSGFYTGIVTNMEYMFQNCTSLTNVNLSSFVTTFVDDMTCMFDGCESLARLDVSNFNTSSVGESQNMFSGMIGLTELILGPEFDFGLKGSTPAALPTPFKAGEDFLGWSEDKNSVIVEYKPDDGKSEKFVDEQKIAEILAANGENMYLYPRYGRLLSVADIGKFIEYAPTTITYDTGMANYGGSVSPSESTIWKIFNIKDDTIEIITPDSVGTLHWGFYDGYNKYDSGLDLYAKAYKANNKNYVKGTRAITLEDARHIINYSSELGINGVEFINSKFIGTQYDEKGRYYIRLLNIEGIDNNLYKDDETGISKAKIYESSTSSYKVEAGFRPIVSLDLLVLTGSGTYDDPYKVKLY